MDDLSGKINEILSDHASMERIKNLAAMLAGTGGGNQNTAPDPEEKNVPAPNTPNNDFPIDPAMLMKLKNAFDLINKDDPRITLLAALKPNLSASRRKKIDDAIHILRLLSLMPILKEQGLFKDLF